MGQQGPVHVDLCWVLCGPWKCLALSVPVSESWRRQVMLLLFTALIPNLTVFNNTGQKKKYVILIIYHPDQHSGVRKLPYVFINNSFTGIRQVYLYLL